MIIIPSMKPNSPNKPERFKPRHIKAATKAETSRV